MEQGLWSTYKLRKILRVAGEACLKIPNLGATFPKVLQLVFWKGVSSREAAENSVPKNCTRELWESSCNQLGPAYQLCEYKPLGGTWAQELAPDPVSMSEKSSLGNHL